MHIHAVIVHTMGVHAAGEQLKYLWGNDVKVSTQLPQLDCAALGECNLTNAFQVERSFQLFQRAVHLIRLV